MSSNIINNESSEEEQAKLFQHVPRIGDLADGHQMSLVSDNLDSSEKFKHSMTTAPAGQASLLLLNSLAAGSMVVQDVERQLSLARERPSSSKRLSSKQYHSNFVIVMNRHMEKSFDSVIEKQDEEQSSYGPTKVHTPEDQSENDFMIEISSNHEFDQGLARGSGASDLHSQGNVTNGITHSMLQRADLSKNLEGTICSNQEVNFEEDQFDFESNLLEISPELHVRVRLD